MGGSPFESRHEQAVMSVTLAFIGDIMLGRMVDAMLASRSPESVWGSALPILRKADAVFGNLNAPSRIVESRSVASARRSRFAHALLLSMSCAQPACDA
jgi:hypothetical protein